MFNKAWFQKHQRPLLAFVNTRSGRWFFALDKVDVPIGASIMEVAPNHLSYDWRIISTPSGPMIEKKTMFFTAQRLQRRLDYVYAYAKRFLGAGLTAKLMQPAGAFGFLPLLALTTSTFYPNANVETTSVDGEVVHSYGLGSGVSWATLRAAAGAGKDDSYETCFLHTMDCDNVYNQYRKLGRSIFLFDTAAIPDTDTVSAATLSVKGYQKTDDGSFAADTNVYASTPASNTALANGDYAQLGSTAFSSALSYSSFSTSAYNDFVLNASGLAAITKTGVSKFGFRNANYDVANSAPTWSSNKTWSVGVYTADRTGTSEDPKLVVTHAAPPVTKTVTDTLTLTTAASSLRTAIKTVLETLTLTTARKISLARTILSALTLTTVASGIRTVLKTVTDTLALTSSVVRSITRTVSNTLTLTTSRLVSLARTVLGGTLTMTSAVKRSLARTVIDTLHFLAPTRLLSVILNGAIINLLWRNRTKPTTPWSKRELP